MQVAGVAHSLMMCDNSVQCGVNCIRDTLRCTTAEIAGLSASNWTFLEGKDVCCCLTQIIPRIIHETDADNQVILYG